MTKDELLTAIKEMSVLELSELVKALEEEFGVSAAPPMMAAMPGMAVAAAGAPAEAAVEEEQTEFDVILKDFGPKKIDVIKVVRQLTSLGLKEAKDMVEGAPQPVMQAVGKEIAAEAKAKLEEVGAVVELK